MLHGVVKIIAKVTLGRIKEYLEHLIEKDQTGFRSVFPCIDNINILFYSRLYILFIDFEKALTV